MREDLSNLELNLQRLAQAVAYPATPQLTDRVSARIADRTVPAPRAPRAWQVLGAALAASIVGLAVVVGTLAPARETLADLVDRINIFQAAEIPSNLPTDIRGEPMTLEDAQQRLSWRIAQPQTADGSTLETTKVLFQQFSPGGPRGIAIFYAPADSSPFVLFETDAGLGKGLGSGATSERLSGLGDGPAYWLRGLRIVQLYDAAGNLIRESQRQTNANTLVWTQDNIVFRIEGELSQEEALRLAHSLK